MLDLSETLTKVNVLVDARPVFFFESSESRGRSVGYREFHQSALNNLAETTLRDVVGIPNVQAGDKLCVNELSSRE